METKLFREPGERPLPASLRARVPESKGRPRQAYRPLVRSEEDADALRRRGVPVYLLTDRLVSALGYPISFPPQLLVGRAVRSAVESPFRMIPVASEEAVAHPRIEDVAVALLEFDPVVARVVLERNRNAVDPGYLLKRVLVEDKERLATVARFFDLAPALPIVGEPLPESFIEREVRKNPPPNAIP